MEQKDKISIALATYNGEKYLRMQLDSLLGQSLPFDELIVCDDCSSDHTPQILREYADADPRIRVIVNDRNLGFRSNFEKAISLCNGNLIALCDQDDVWLEDHLAVLADNIGDSLLIAGASILTDGDGNTDGTRLAYVKNFQSSAPGQEGVFKFLMYYQNPFQGASMMLRREFLKVALPVPREVNYHDVWFVHVAALMGGFKFVDIPVTNYRLHGSNTSGNHHKTSRLRTIVGHMLHSRFGNNRPQVAAALKQRASRLPEEAMPLIEEACSYYRDRSIGRRIVNLIFELKNYKKIYGRENQ